MEPAARRRRVLALALVAACSVVPRVLDVDRMVSPDEKRWLTHSANFYRALTHGELAHAYQIEHPGVTVMWVGTLNFLLQYPEYPWEAPGQVDWRREEVATFLRAQGREPLDLLRSAHALMGVVISGVLVASTWWAIRLFGPGAALLGMLLVAFDPFHIALSRLLHLDGLTSAFVLLSLLALLCWLHRGRRRRDLLLSGAAAGLAVLTKSPALFLVPFAALLLGWDVIARRSWAGAGREDWRAALVSFAVWGATAFAVFVVLWPAMWVDPIWSVGRMLAAAVGYAVQGHEDPLYFHGRIYEGDPGALFYPATYLWRTTPPALIGLALVLGGLAVGARWLPREHRGPVGALLLFALLFVAFMNLGSKKFDRYVLAVHPPLTLAAAVGWVGAGRWLRERLAPRLAPAVLPAIAAATLGTQAALAGRAYPYFFSYYNPLLGGTRAAPAVMMVGWGEGLDQVARYLKARTDVPSPRVMIGVWGGTFSYYFRGEIRDSKFAPGSGTAAQWTTSDFAVVYINQWQREQIPRALMTYLAGLRPALTVRLQGLPYAYVYDIRGVPPPPYTTRDTR